MLKGENELLNCHINSLESTIFSLNETITNKESEMSELVEKKKELHANYENINSKLITLEQ